MALTQTEVSQLYVSIFGRASEGEGNQFWQNSTNLTTAATQMLETSAAISYFGTAISSNQDFIEHIYLNTLNKSVTDDSEGISFWVNSLDKGLSRGFVVSELISAINDSANSGDAQDQFNNRVEVSNYTANTINEAPSDYATSLSFNSGLTVTSDSTTIQSAKVNVDLAALSKTTVVSSVEIEDGNYTSNGIVYIDVNFSDNFIVSGVDSTLNILLGTVEKKATLHAYSNDKIIYKYVVEDGYASEDVIVGVMSNGIALNSTTIKDVNGLHANLNFDALSNNLAVISDLTPPEYEIYNTHYDSNTNKLSIFGEGFNTLLEYDENSATDVIEKIDFTKLVWDIDSDDNGTTNTVVTFSSSDISSAKVENNNQMDIILAATVILEDTTNYGSTNGVDSIDILSGFLSDTASNISTTATKNDIFLGIDNIILGESSEDILYGTKNDDVMLGLSQNDTLYGFEGNDTMSGGTGDDIIDGGRGVDNLTGDTGNDIFVFKDNDSLPLFELNFGIDRIHDLVLDSNSADLIDLDVSINQVNDIVTGSVTQGSFINDMNMLLSVDNRGFDATSINISASIVNVTSGDLINKSYLVVDYNSNSRFDSDDFVVEITGAVISNMTIDTFI